MQWGGVPKIENSIQLTYYFFSYLLCSTINRGHLDWLEHSSQPLDFNSWNRLPLDSSRTELPLDSSSTAYIFWGFYKFNFCATKMVTQNFRKRSRKKKFSAKFRIFCFALNTSKKGEGDGKLSVLLPCHKTDFCVFEFQTRKRWKIEIFLSL